MEIILVKRDSAEWLYMLLWLELEYVDYDVWEYVGSYHQQDITVHEFKHLITSKLINLKASDTFTEKEIEKIIKKY